MCGICGYFGEAVRDGGTLLAAMNETLVRRGPDDAGSFVGPLAGMAMRRLSIQDVAGGHQPIFNEDRTVSVVFNGEIYNQRELRKELEAGGHCFRTTSDTEVLVHLYEEHGASLVDHLRGMFAFAIYDSTKRRMLLARDRLGIKPLFYAHERDTIYFASEIKALKAVSRSIGTLDVQAVDAFFAFGYIPAPLTIYKEIRKLEPGHMLTVTRTGTVSRRYWDLEFCGKEELKEDEWVERVDSAVHSAVTSHLISDVPVGAFLSGGVDSGLVSAVATSSLGYPLESFTIGFEGRSNPLIDERRHAREFATRYETVHHESAVHPDFKSVAPEILDAFDEPFADDSVIPSYYVSRAASESVKVVLSGLGGDELFGGYQRHIGFDLSRLYQHMPDVVHRHVVDPLIQRLPEPRSGGDRVDHVKRFSAAASLPAARRYAGYAMALGSAERRALYTPELAEQIDFDQTESILTNHFVNCDSDDDLDRMLYADCKTYLPEDILALSDRISMWHSLEVRVPLLDHRLVELAATIPSSLKIRRGQGKRLLKRVAERYLPHGMIHHRKQGFEAPMGAWLRNELFDTAREVFQKGGAGSALVDVGFLDEKLLEHKQGRRKNNKLLFSSMVMLLWAERKMWSL